MHNRARELRALTAEAFMKRSPAAINARSGVELDGDTLETYGEKVASQTFHANDPQISCLVDILGITLEIWRPEGKFYRRCVVLQPQNRDVSDQRAPFRLTLSREHYRQMCIIPDTVMAVAKTTADAQSFGRVLYNGYLLSRERVRTATGKSLGDLRKMLVTRVDTKKPSVQSGTTKGETSKRQKRGKMTKAQYPILDRSWIGFIHQVVE